MSGLRLITALLISTCVCAPLTAGSAPQQPGASAAAASRLEALKRQAAAEVDSTAKFTQQTNDLLFSFSELGFQEFETSKYLCPRAT